MTKERTIEVINRGRVTGRTTELIRRCAKHNYALIVTPSKARAQTVFKQARSQDIYIPFPITFKEFCRGEFCGKNVEAFLFDDLDASLKEMAMWAPIEAVVIEGNETNTGDLISRETAINELWKALYEYEDKTEKQFQESEDLNVEDWIEHRIFVQNMNDIDRRTILNLLAAYPERLTKASPSAQPQRIDNEEKKKRLLAEELRARKIMIEDFEGIIHDVIPEIDVYDAIEEVLGWKI